MTSNFDCVRMEAEHKSISDIWNKYCVVLKHGIYKCFTYQYALEHDYPIVCVTIY